MQTSITIIELIKQPKSRVFEALHELVKVYTEMGIVISASSSKRMKLISGQILSSHHSWKNLRTITMVNLKQTNGGKHTILEVVINLWVKCNTFTSYIKLKIYHRPMAKYMAREQLFFFKRKADKWL